jgi:hypothetical protein
MTFTKGYTPWNKGKIGKDKSLEKIEEVFWKHIKIGEDDECWEWQSAKLLRGYGKLRIGKTKKSAHRFSYELHKGEIPKGMCVCHSCDNPPCCNPKHLWLGTTRENTQDMIKKGRGVYASGEKSGVSKLTQKQVNEIRELYKIGKYTHRKLAEKFNVVKGTITFILQNKTWKI